MTRKTKIITISSVVVAVIIAVFVYVRYFLGNGKMIHASSSKKQVVVEVLENDYFKDRIVDIRRYK